MHRCRRHLIVTCALLLVCLGAAGAASARPLGLPKLDGRNPITGKPVALAAYAGKPLVLHVWASWCPTCNAEAPTIASAAARYRNVAFIGIDIADNARDAKGFYRRHGWHFSSIDEPTRTRMAVLGVPGQPSTVFVNAKREIVARIIGPASAAQIALGIKLASKR